MNKATALANLALEARGYFVVASRVRYSPFQIGQIIPRTYDEGGGWGSVEGSMVIIGSADIDEWNWQRGLIGLSPQYNTGYNFWKVKAE